MSDPEKKEQENRGTQEEGQEKKVKRAKETSNLQDL